jgi:hypothetical protein
MKLHTPPSKPHQPTRQILLHGTVAADGLGGLRVVPVKSLAEVSSRQAAEILDVCQGSLSLIVDTPLGQKHLRWRWLTEKQGKRVFELDSVRAYQEAKRNRAAGRGIVAKKSPGASASQKPHR